MRVRVGDNVGQYRLIEQLGQGGMAVVFRAHQPSLDREVAVKILTATGGTDFVERFRREARAVSRLRHPYILTVFDFGELDDLVYMVGEYVPGGTLAGKLGSPLPLNWVGVRLVALASALDYAHASGLIHRDVKPTNILLTANDMPILSDFGVAKLVQEGAAGLTGLGMVVGTPEYMSPEQALGQEVGPPSDVYSLGVVLYEMLVGRPPFAGLTPVAVALAHVHNPPPRPTSVNPNLLPAVEQALLTCLEKNANDRYQHASELANAYAAAIGVDPQELLELAAVTPPSMPRISATPDLPVAWPASTTPVPALPRTPATSAYAATGTPQPIPAPPPPRQSRWTAILGGLVGLVLIGALAVFFSGVLTVPPVVAPTPTTPRPTPTAVAVLNPTATPLPPPTSLPATPTLPVQIAPTSASLGLQVLSPANGARVAETIIVRGNRVGPMGPDQHLWLMARPRQGPENWWALDNEIVPTPAGEWTARVFLGGDPGTLHRLVIGVVGQSGQELITKHLAENPGQPFPTGLPTGFTPLADITVEKGS